MKQNTPKYISYFALVVFLYSCGTTSEIVSKSSKNIQKGQAQLTVGASLNPTVMPMSVVKDTNSGKISRKFVNFSKPENPVFSGQIDYGVSNFYNAGLGLDLSLRGIGIIVNNKFEFTKSNQKSDFKRIRLSYYNKSSFSTGKPMQVAEVEPHRVAHFEIGNYLLVGLFIDKYELILSPHIDYNYLISENYVDDIIENNVEIKGQVEDHKLSFTNYGINLALKTPINFIFEAGFQYIGNSNYKIINDSGIYQFSFGVGYVFSKKKI
jgi:hypothetical protein